MKHEPEKWQADYARDGYLVVKDLVDPETLGKLRAELDKLAVDPDSLPPSLHHHIQFERDYVKSQPQYNDKSVADVGNAMRNIMELPRFGRVFSDFIVYNPLLDVLEAVFESPEFHFHNYKCIIKAPKISSQFRWHRDLPYLEHSTHNLITAMICVDPMTETNGATVVLPGSHRVGCETVKPGDMEMQEKDLPDMPRVSVTCPAGSAVLFHVNIVHGGPANRSDIPRRNVIGIWAGPDTYPVTQNRYVYQGLFPRTQDPAKKRQVEMTFPHLFGKNAAARTDFDEAGLEVQRR